MRTSGDNDAADSMEQESENRRKGIWKSLLESELKSLSITEKNLSSMVYTNSLNTIAGCYYGLDQYTEAAHYFDLYSKSLRQMLQEKFLLLTDIDRKRVWDEQQQHIDDYRFNVAALPTSVTDLMHLYVPVLYDLELISKGIMLNSVIEFEKVLEQNGNKELIQIYKTIKENQQKIDKLESTVSEENLQKVLALKQTNASLQQKLMTSCAAYSDYTKYLSYTWRDIQAKLGKNDIAIEFTTVPLSPLDKDNYILALILSSTGEPTMSVISTRAILKNMKEKEDLYANRQYYDMIWGFMQEHLTGKQRVYFAPDNNLSDIAIEYLNDGQQTFFEKYEVYRLSSTKELCRDYSETTCEKSITIFGDIDYNTELVAAKRGGTLSFGKLKYGREEIDGIKSFVAKSYKTNVYDGKKATEKLFRELSNKNPMILHISSHGEYNGDDKINETDAMENSLLALSGANADSDDILNDGIITAADIAQMNLRQCDMAVLSACNTGIGGKGTDGIFGLQRGFKNAGVHSLLMSLKPVYDESTAKLMIAFYQGLAQGKSKRQSLLDAQKHIRSIGYTEGKYWAPFILLDGIK
jgi:CHAT domain-containing protein